MSTWTDLSKDMADAVEKAGAYTVLVIGRPRLPATGIAFDKEYILTADHVVERDEDIKVMLPDGTILNAEVAGRDYGTDIALLKLEKPAATPAKTSSDFRVGQMVLALGRSRKSGVQASLGIVSAIGGEIHTAQGGTLEQHIRTDAIPYPGFSGGALIDAAGNVIALNTSGLGHGSLLGIPVQIAWKIAEVLKEHGKIKRGYLGVRTQTIALPAKAKLPRKQQSGLLTIGVEEESPALAAGLMVGDIVVGLNGKALGNHEQLLGALSGDVVDTESQLEILRGGEFQTIKITIVERTEHNDPHNAHHGGGRRGMHRRGGPMGRRRIHKIMQRGSKSRGDSQG